ncbi:MAG: hypothetical protein PHW04_15710, partial [Candidatus Wallbacteria bacterium]|nr:hypothetical protein [Candidatus Wallbacteria bacterium]
MNRKSFSAFFTLLFLFLIQTSVLRAGVLWLGSTDANWGTDTNWSPAAVPLESDDVTISYGTYQPTIHSTDGTLHNGLVRVNSITVNNGATLNLNGNELHVTTSTAGFIVGGTIEMIGSVAEIITPPNLLSTSKVIYTGTNDGISEAYIIQPWNTFSSIETLIIAGIEIGANKDSFHLQELTEVNTELNISNGEFWPTNYALTVRGTTEISSNGILNVYTTGQNITFNGPMIVNGTGHYIGGVGAVANEIFGGDITISGGTFDATIRNTYFSGSNQIFNHSGGTFNHNNGSVEVTGSGTVEIKGNNSFNILACLSPGKIIRFDNTSTCEQTINTLKIQGTSENLVNLVSTNDGDTAQINVTNSNVNYATVKDSKNSGTLITAVNSSNKGNNFGWNFGTIVWTGGKDTAWSEPKNWKIGLFPSIMDSVEIGACANQPILTNTAEVNRLTIDANATLKTNGWDFTISGGSGSFIVNGTLETKGNETFNIVPALNSGSKVIYKGTGALNSQIKSWTYKNISLAGAAGDTFKLPGADLAVGETLEITGGTFTTYDGAADRNLSITGNTLISGGTLTIHGNSTFSCTGAFSNAGTFTGGTSTNTFNSDWTNTSSYTATAGSTILNGALTFNNTSETYTPSADFIVQGAGTVNFRGSSAFNNFTCTTAGKTLNFEQGKTQTISGTFTITGTAGSLITLASSGSGAYTLDVTGSTQTVTFADIQYCAAGSHTATANF